MNRNLTQFRHSEIDFQPSLTAQNRSLDMRQPEISRTYRKIVLIVLRINFEKQVFHQIAKLETLSLKSL